MEGIEFIEPKDFEIANQLNLKNKIIRYNRDHK